jgi:hypothetical protein
MVGGVAQEQVWDPEFKPLYHQKKNGGLEA